jgi:glycosyltransferase involved in cell wall biosynthesis
MRVAFLTRYGPKGASSRVRAYQFESALQVAGIESVFFPLLGDGYLSARYAGGRIVREVARALAQRLRHIGRARSTDLLWIEKELLPYFPAIVEGWLLAGRPYVIDFDDAIFHNYDLSDRSVVRYLLGRKIDRLMAMARIVTVGNAYLHDRAIGAGAERIERLPSVIDIENYRLKERPVADNAKNLKVVVVWIGSPATVRYLDLVRDPLQRLAARTPIELRVIGAPAPCWPGVCSSSVEWAADKEAELLVAGDIGIMPLRDGPWERGKCGYKLIQYMACGLPVVASAVGVNGEIVSHGVDGFLSTTDDQWADSLYRLASDPKLRADMGRRGRVKVEQKYSVQAIAPRFAALLREAAG